MAQQTVMQELYKHFLDVWSSPGDCWNPGKVIDKIESMIEKEKEQIIQARITAPLIPTLDKNDYLKEAEQYYNETYGGQGSPDTSPNTQNK